MIYVIVGPTGVGKTKLSEALALKYDGVVINADAVQIYKKLNIGSAKVTKEEMADVPHFLFDIKDITEDYNVKNYQEDLRNIIEQQKDKDIFIVGGTGLYISAGLFDYTFEEEETNNAYDNLTTKEMYDLVKLKDKDTIIHQNNRQRLIRELNRKENSNKGSNILYDALFIGLTTNRDNLYNIINKRVDKMFSMGLLEEVKELLPLKKDSRVLNSAIGYKEVIEFLEEKISYEEMLEKLKKNSRNYAKRQYTWFNNKIDVNWFDTNYENFDETIDKVIKFIEEKK